ncbi:hypothetical protein BG006_010823 [Podila minutissima]|uniref:Rho guanine nucleotide exchange factor scd1 n=1 Tax=Podila minutissima TaxID=64525 RepID=A0A9P5SFI2_9FUNG|nr:hypothetical protein BG006_010823 [Podila minutissima]
MAVSPTFVDQPPPPLQRGNSVVSLYQSCLNLLERLSGVPDFEQYLDPELLLNTQAGSPSGSPNDPVNQLWVLFRMGSPLATIFNGLRPKEPLKINNTDANLSNINACKASVFRFLVACRTELQLTEEDLFTISELYQDDTNGFVKVIKTISMVLDRMEDQGLLKATRTKRLSDPAKPTDNRAKVVNEILETERSFVQDLENLQAYMRALQTDGTVISPETIHLIFANLNALVDFQRRFLIAVETNAAFSPQDQNFGQVFLQHEEAFAVYEPFCANFAEASKLILQEAPKLAKMAHLMEPIHGITSQLIKPVQRICKYPLFMHELIKLTDSEFPYYRDLVQGQASIKRVADRINETNRKQDNHLIAQALQHKVAWKDGELVSDFGTLLLHDKMLNPRGGDLEIYLFETILVCCQEIVVKKKQVKPLPKGAKPKPTLHLNGRIYINNIKSILPVSVSGSYVIHVVWNSDAEEFELRCRNDDQLKKWHGVLDKLVTEANAQKANIVSTTNFIGMPTMNHEQSSFYREDDDYLDDDLDGDEEDGYSDEPRGYRSNSLPFGLTPQPHMLGSRPRAKTEDGSVPPAGSWNARVAGYTQATAGGRPSIPGMSLPPLPRTTSSSSTAMGVMSPGEYPYSPPSSYPASPTVSNSRGSTSSSSSWQRRSNGEGHSPMTETMSKFMSHDDEYNTHGQPLLRNASSGYSYNATPSNAPPVPQIPGQLRVRAQSSPNIHAAANPQWHNAPEMPTPSHHRRPSNASGPNSPTTPYGAYPNIPAVPTIPSRHSSPRPDVSRTLRQQPSSSNLSAGGPQLKIKVNFQEDAYLIVVPTQIGYNELIERVEKKIRLCGRIRSDSHPLRLRYKDEDNDYIIMKDDDDISLAFESCYAEGVMNLHVS